MNIFTKKRNTVKSEQLDDLKREMLNKSQKNKARKMTVIRKMQNIVIQASEQG